ncbi:MAG: hypothetical protein ACLTDX_22885 [[Clostridium] innocuum]
MQQAELDWERLLQQEEDMKQLYVYLERQKELIKVLPEWNTFQSNAAIYGNSASITCMLWRSSMSF